MKLSFVWSLAARAQLRGIERETAMRILVALTRYAETGEGDIKALEWKFTGITAFVSVIGGFDSNGFPVARSTCSR